MKINIAKEWCLKMAELEDDSEINAGLLAIDPIFDGDVLPIEETSGELSIAFGRFVRLMRRNRGLTIEKLADDADIDVVELVGIEDDTHYKPDPRTVYQLANFFDVPRAKLMEISGLTVPRDDRLVEEAMRFAARSDPLVELTVEERAALDAFVAVLSDPK